MPRCAESEPTRSAVLVIVGGLPATGKTTVARRVALALRAAFLRIDTIETAIGRAEGRGGETNDWEQPPGYLVGYDVAADQLRLGLDVVAESVNPVQTSRDAWRDAGRAEERVLDIAGLNRPTWAQITSREYQVWDREHLVVDTAVLGSDGAADLVLAAAAEAVR